jgi:polyphenol oxidase
MKYPETAEIKAQVENGLLYYTFPLFEPFGDCFLHAFSSRLGGMSEVCYASLNLGFGRGDDDDLVRQNYACFGAAVGFDWRRAVLSVQTHGVEIRHCTAEDAGKGPVFARDYQSVDGLLTLTPELPLITQYADCVPLLFYAADKRIAATAHAGWRGTVAGIGKAMVDRLVELGADRRRIYAAIGPAAGPCCYEVDADIAARFAPFDDEAGPVVQEVAGVAGKYILDLWRVNREILCRAGLLQENISIAGLCTICNPDIFYSHRVQGDERGSLAAMVMLRG